MNGPCVALTLRLVLDRGTYGWEEQRTVGLEGADGCTAWEVALPDGAYLSDLSGWVLTPDGRRERLRSDRILTGPPAPDGARTARILLPELDGGGLAELRFLRLLTDPVDWSLNTGGAAFTEVRPPKGATLTGDGWKLDGRWWWFDGDAPPLTLTHTWAATSPALTPPVDRTDLSADEATTLLAGVVPLGRAWDGPSPLAGRAALARGAADDRGLAATFAALTGGLTTDPRPPQPPTEATWSVDVRVLLPPGEPRTALASPRAEVRFHATATLPDDGHATALALPLPADRLSVLADLPDDGTVRVSGDTAFLVAPPGTTTFTATLHTPLRDLWGALPWGAKVGTGRVSQTARDGSEVDVGELVVDPDGTWRLVRVGEVSLATDRAAVEAALVRRRAYASLPEPAIPLRMVSHKANWEAVGLIPAWIHERALPAPLDLPPAKVRPLVRARNAGLLTEHELATIAARFAEQLAVSADVVLVAADGPGAAVVPVGYDRALVRLTLGDEVRWLDPACASCIPFTVRPELVGRPAFGAGLDRVPDLPVPPAE